LNFPDLKAAQLFLGLQAVKAAKAKMAKVWLEKFALESWLLG